MATVTSFSYELIKKSFMIDGLPSETNDIIKLLSTRTGSELPNHRAIISGQGNATTALTASRETASNRPGFARCVSKDPYGGTAGNYKYRDRSSTGLAYGWSTIVPSLTDTNDSVSKARAIAIGRYYQKLSSLNSPVAGQVFAGELHKTIQMLRNPFASGVKLLEYFLRNKASVKMTAKTIASLWLEVRFGLLPLISDIDGIINICVAKARQAEVTQHRCYGASVSSSTVPWSGSDILGMTYHGTITRTFKAEHIIRFGHLKGNVDRKGAVFESFKNSFLDIREVLNTAWELVPYSFLIDYFLNVGSIIQAATSAELGQIYTSQSTIMSASAVLSVDRYVLASNYRDPSFTPALCSRTLRTVSRTSAPVGIPSLTFTLPGSNIRLANIAALLTNLLLKGK